MQLEPGPSTTTEFANLAGLSGSPKREAASRSLERLCDPATLEGLFDEYMDRLEEEESAVVESYAHDNGYDKIVLHQDNRTQMKLRLHIWWPVAKSGQERPRQNIHNHRWDFSSAILTGKIEHVTYRFARPNELGTELNHYRYHPRGSKNHYDLENKGTASVIEIERHGHSKGDIYSVQNEVLHRIDIPRKLLVATLVITHENVGWFTNDLLTEKELGFGHSVHPSPPLSKMELFTKIGTLRGVLGC